MTMRELFEGVSNAGPIKGFGDAIDELHEGGGSVSSLTGKLTTAAVMEKPIPPSIQIVCEGCGRVNTPCNCERYYDYAMWVMAVVLTLSAVAFTAVIVWEMTR